MGTRRLSFGRGDHHCSFRPRTLRSPLSGLVPASSPPPMAPQPPPSSWRKTPAAGEAALAFRLPSPPPHLIPPRRMLTFLSSSALRPVVLSVDCLVESIPRKWSERASQRAAEPLFGVGDKSFAPTSCVVNLPLTCAAAGR